MRCRPARAAPVLAAAALALPAASPAQTTGELLQELRELKARVERIEAALKAREAREAQDAQARAAPASASASASAPSPSPSLPLPQAQTPPQAQPPAPSGMTPQQVQDLNRLEVRTERIEDTLQAQGLRGLRIGGQIDPTYVYNRAQRRAGFQLLSPMRDGRTHYDESFFGMAVLDVQKELDNGMRLRLTLAPQRGAGAAAASDGSRSAVHEASAVIPLGDSPARVLLGQIPSWAGYEGMLPAQNRLVTHNLLFDFTQPRAYTGAGAGWISGQWEVKALLANLDEGVRAAGRRTPVLVYRADWARNEFRGYGFSGVHGKAPNRVNGGPDALLNLFEVDGFHTRGDWTIRAQLSLGRRQAGAITPDPLTGALRDSRWWGVSGLVGYRLAPRWDVTARLDYLNDSAHGGGLYATGLDARDGIGPAMLGRAPDGRLLLRDAEHGANRYALSVGLGYAFSANAFFKAEYRLDRATLPVFEVVEDGGFRRSNHLFGASMVLSF